MLCFDCFQLVSVLLLYRFLMSPLFYFLVMLFVCFCLWVAHLHCCKSDTTSHALCSMTTHTHTTDHILYPYSHIPPTTHIYPWRERRMSSFVPDSGWWRYRAGTKQTMPRFGYILRFQIPDRFLWFWLLMTLLLLLLFMLLVFYDVLFWCDVVVIVDNYYDLVW